MTRAAIKTDTPYAVGWRPGQYERSESHVKSGGTMANTSSKAELELIQDR